MLGDPREPETQFHGRHRCPVRPVHYRGVPGHVRSTTARVRRQSVGTDRRVGAKTPISSLAVLGKTAIAKLQLEASRQPTRWRDFLYLEEPE